MKINKIIIGVCLIVFIGFIPYLSVFADNSKTLILRYAKPSVFGSGIATDCSDVNNNVIKFIKSTPEQSIMCVPSQQLNISANPLNEITNAAQANWQVYNAPSNRLYNSSAENLNMAVLTPPYEGSDNIVTFTYQLMTSGTDTFQYQLTNAVNGEGTSFTATYNNNLYTLQNCQEDTTDSTGQYIVCIFQYTPSSSE